MGEEKEIQFEKKKMKVRLDLWDTAGQEEFDRIRPLSYREANYFLLCFAVNSRDSFDHITEKWVPEIKHHQPRGGFLLVGLKGDLQSQISQQEIEKCSKEIGADAYIQASALTNANIDHVFEVAMSHYFKPKQKKKAKNCLIL